MNISMLITENTLGYNILIGSLYYICYKVSYTKNKDSISHGYNCSISDYNILICVLYNIHYKAPYIKV